MPGNVGDFKYGFEGMGVTPEYLDMVTKCLERDWRPLNVRVHGVSRPDDGPPILAIRFDDALRGTQEVGFPAPQPGSGEQ